MKENEEKKRIAKEKGENVVIRLKMPTDEEISFIDIVREKVSFRTNDLDDKVIMKNVLTIVRVRSYHKI